MQVLPPHILTGLRGGTRVLVEKFPDVALLCADVVGFSSLAATADTPDCILMLNRWGSGSPRGRCQRDSRLCHIVGNNGDAQCAFPHWY